MLTAGVAIAMLSLTGVAVLLVTQHMPERMDRWQDGLLVAGLASLVLGLLMIIAALLGMISPWP